ncbi:rhodanese-like domain-containing protein [Paenibacillus glycinis]|uniref:Rhodanese domain-containing protein n=1 Tax=Paenibacillus glycinis TaxID=2697035 RepID=A0ABW9Y1M4_9BACL|nr:rhodanese-like domain-containing protein [Paenibacillus glycinis]NBD28361.1 hypothetical protein [Paenibacillus glycinis]
MESLIKPNSLFDKLKEGQSSKVIDVRSPEEFEQGHIPGAQNIPIDQLSDRISEIPIEQPIITYCNMNHPGHSRGEKAQQLLSEKGFKVKAIDGGFNEWNRLKLPIETEK